MIHTPLTSVILVTWNSKEYLSSCLSALSKQTFRDFDIILMDNGSRDDALDKLHEKFPLLNLHVHQLYSNLGFAVANNIGASLARGQLLVLLNTDAFPEPDWLENLVNTSYQFPNACLSSRQIQANSPKYLDGEGDNYFISGFARRRNYNVPIYPTDELTEIFSPCAAAALYPRQAFLDAGGFDEEYFAYHEDVDLGFRLRLRGLKCYHVPQAVVHHVGSASQGRHSNFYIYYGHRNLIWTYVKNMPTFLFWLFLPLHIGVNISALLWFTLKGHGRAIWRSKIDALLGMGAILQKRKCVQSGRQVPLKEIYRVLDKQIFSPLQISLKRRYSETDK